MLAPRTGSLSRRSSTSLSGSKASMTSHRSSSSRQTSLSSDYYGSQYSLRRSSLPNSTPSTPRHKEVQVSYNQHRHNAEWNVDRDKGSLVSQGPPSLATSDTSVLTEQWSRSSSQTSLLHPPPGMQHSANDAIVHRLGSPREALLRAALRQHATKLYTNDNLQRSRRKSSFLPSSQIKERDTWGQFVDTEEAERDLARRSKILSLTRRYRVNSSHLSPQLR